jgi:hypothetical protein
MIHSFQESRRAAWNRIWDGFAGWPIVGYPCPQKSLVENRMVLIGTPLQPTQLRETDTIQYPFYFKRLY